VLDQEFRVRGFDSLRVIDGSAMPQIVRGPTNAPIIMMAEVAADLLRGRAPNHSAAATASGFSMA
jgi:choline dehydrogenase-like flavoprotein